MIAAVHAGVDPTDNPVIVIWTMPRSTRAWTLQDVGATSRQMLNCNYAFNEKHLRAAVRLRRQRAAIHG